MFAAWLSRNRSFPLSLSLASQEIPQIPCLLMSSRSGIKPTSLPAFNSNENRLRENPKKPLSRRSSWLVACNQWFCANKLKTWVLKEFLATAEEIKDPIERSKSRSSATRPVKWRYVKIGQFLLTALYTCISLCIFLETAYRLLAPQQVFLL